MGFIFLLIIIAVIVFAVKKTKNTADNFNVNKNQERQYTSKCADTTYVGSEDEDNNSTDMLANGKTLAQTITDAKNGDINSMCALGGYYSGKFSESNDVDALEKSNIWLKKAVDCGADASWVHMLLSSQMFIDAWLSFGVGMYEEAISKCESILDYSGKAKKMCTDLSRDDIDSIDSNADAANYYAAYSCYKLKKPDKALNYLKTACGTKEKLLKGACIFGSKSFETTSGCLECYNLLKSCEQDKEYFNSSKSEEDETMFALSVGYLSTLYRTGGINKCFPADINKAVSILEAILPVLSLDKTKSFIQGQLAHYRKDVFGRYKYID